jgi:glycosyltransferase involved in cell wall biosynthesis
MSPDISVIIPAYNVAPYVAVALDSALAQPGVSLEVIVVDDGSTDGTAEVLARYAGDARVTIISQDNTGPCVSRNVGISRARGRYIGFLDGDDLWDQGKAAAHVTLMDSRPDLDTTYSWWRIINGNGAPTGRTNTCAPADLPAGSGFEGLLVENFTGTASTLVCRRAAIEAVGGFDPALRSNVDLDLLLRLALLREGNLALVPEILTSYRVHGSQITGDWRRMEENWNKVLRKMRGLAPVRVAPVERLARGRVYRYLAYIAYVRGDGPNARRLMGQAWCLAPRSMAADFRCWLISMAVASTVLPPRLQAILAGNVQRLLWRAPTR